MEATATATKPFRLSEFVKDGYLAEALSDEISELRGKELELAQAAIAEVATSGIQGNFDDLLARYRRAIRRSLNPGLKTVRNAKVDRTIVRNEQLAAHLDRELRDVTEEELKRVNQALKRTIEAAREVTARAQGAKGEERMVRHPASAVCRDEEEHSTLGGRCGYFRDPGAWKDMFVQIVRQAIAGE